VASFTNRDRAELFSDFMKSKLGSGDVGEPTLSANSSTETSSQTNCPVVVSDPGSPLNVRATPDETLDNVVGKLEDGTSLTVIAEQNGWLRLALLYKAGFQRSVQKQIVRKSAQGKS
jgi:uncharacterized protein YgiM (DUF1202 family)